MMTGREIIEWITALGHDELIGIGEDGMTLENPRTKEALEVGMVPERYPNSPPEHVKVLHGQCPICHHYGDDCTGRDLTK